MNKGIWMLPEDDETDKTLLSLVQRHIKLAVEFNHKTTNPERRKSIQAEIVQLRDELARHIYPSNNLF